MSRRGAIGLRLVAAVMVLGLITAACRGAEEEAPEGGEAPAKPGEGITVTIAVNPWTGSAANANVAKIILEQELGYTVELVEIDEFAQFPALAAGDLDATLEVWPSGHAEDYATYIEADAGVVDGGELGVVGNIGWFIPTYLLDEHPEFATWEGFKGEEDLFATAETGDKGQYLGADPSYTDYDKEIIENLGLNFDVVYSGSEAASLTALDSAYQRNDPLIMYFWTPHWAHVKYDLTEVELPAFDDQCAEAALEKKGEGYDCDYADDILYKALSAGLQEKAPEAYGVLSNMSYTNDDQNGIAFQVDSEGMDIAEAAQAWVDEHTDVWQAWLPA
ncbi:MAG: ABC transporter substrate-binding protein [Actinobacteria bacterium]|nr:ABC transporter substrate-binding protein [Actinomycetota bacterium]